MRAAFVLLAIGLAALAPPPIGGRLPDLKARDVDGAERELRALLSREERTLVVAITDRGAADAMQAWFDAADTKAPGAGRVSIVSLRVPFFVSDDYARSKAREKVPEKWREASLFDSDGAMAKALGIEGGKVPWVFAVGRQGEVLAGAHGGVDARDAAAIWRALQISTPPRKSEAAPR